MHSLIIDGITLSGHWMYDQLWQAYIKLEDTGYLDKRVMLLVLQDRWWLKRWDRGGSGIAKVCANHE